MKVDLRALGWGVPSVREDGGSLKTGDGNFPLVQEGLEGTYDEVGQSTASC